MKDNKDPKFQASNLEVNSFYFGCQAPGYWLLATMSKIFGMNRGFDNLGSGNWKLTATDQGQKTSSQRQVASSQ